jgi:hypothetical protein
MFRRRFALSAPLWLAAAIAVLAGATAMRPGAQTAARSDATCPADLLPGEYRGPTFEQVVAYLGGIDSEAALPPDEVD